MIECSDQELSIVIILLTQQQIMATFKLTNINLQVDGANFNQQTKRLLKIDVADFKNSTLSVVKLKQPAEWHQTIVLPAKFDKEYAFEIQNLNHYQFGYNPEDIETIYEGQIVIKKNDGDYCGWQVQMGGKKAGYLFANIELISKLGVKKEVKQVQNVSFFGKSMELKKDSISFTSIYANFPSLVHLQKVRTYFQFQIGGIAQRTAIKRIHKSQYHSYQNLQLKHTNPKTVKLTVSAFSFEGKTNKVTSLGKGSTSLLSIDQTQDKDCLPLHQKVKVERIFLYTNSSQQIGWISFKYIKGKDESLDPRFFLQDKFNTIGDINFRPLKNSSMTISAINDSKMVMSGLQSNSRIFMPKAQRFQNPAKRKKCEQIGICHQSLDFKDYRENPHTYKFTSFGFGRKIDPVERDYDVPGAGRYILPSIFDRFK